jgi:hypothetical protein
MTNREVTILIPNFRTPEITKLCFRLLHKYTDLGKVQVIAIDNGSRDASTEYLQSLKWIKLIERTPGPEESPARSHALALDQALDQVTTPYVLSFHTDTFVRNDRWLDFLLKEIRKSPDIAGVGSWKLDSRSFFQKMGKQVEKGWQSLLFPLLGKDFGRLEGKGENYLYLRIHCALYRVDLIRKYALSFAQNGDTAGRAIHKELVDRGYQMVFIPSEKLGTYIMHLNHATMVLNPELGSRKKSVGKGLKRIEKFLKEINAEQILADEGLDS